MIFGRRQRTKLAELLRNVSYEVVPFKSAEQAVLARNRPRFADFHGNIVEARVPEFVRLVDAVEFALHRRRISG